MKSGNSRLIIIDEYFVQKAGHYYEYNKAVQEIFRQKGWETRIYANKELTAELQQELKAIPAFSGLKRGNTIAAIPVIGNLLNRVIFWKRLYHSLNSMLQQEQKEHTWFFFTTVLWFNILPVALSLKKNKVKAVLMYRVSPYEHVGLPKAFNKLADWIYKYTFSILSGMDNVICTTDSEVLSGEIAPIVHKQVAVLPIPHLNFEQTVTQPAANNTGRIRCYAPGAIREEKGIHFIVAALERLSETAPGFTASIELVTQYSNNPNDQQLNEGVKQRLSKLPVHNIFLGNLDSEAYNNEMANADIILIPYDVAQGYRARTSGIMSEAISYEKPFITTAGSWMQLQAEKYGTGKCIPYNDTDAFGSALQEIATNFEQYKTKAISAKPKWIAFHDKDNFYNIFINAINQ